MQSWILVRVTAQQLLVVPRCGTAVWCGLTCRVTCYLMSHAVQHARHKIWYTWPVSAEKPTFLCAAMLNILRLPATAVLLLRVFRSFEPGSRHDVTCEYLKMVMTAFLNRKSPPRLVQSPIRQVQQCSLPLHIARACCRATGQQFLIFHHFMD
jgi:hypothetical protein